MRRTLAACFATCAAMVIALGFASNSVGEVFTYAATGDPASSPDATGAVDAWVTSFSGSAGSFSGDSGTNGDNTGQGAGALAWALFANSGGTSGATSTFSSVTGSSVTSISLSTEYVSLAFDNGYIETSAGNGGVSGSSVGVEFLTASDAVAARLRFNGGETHYRIDDSVSNDATTVPFTDDGFVVKLTLNDSVGGYTMNVGAAPFSGRTLAGGATSIAKVRVYNFSAGFSDPRNVFFNNLTLNTVPEASAAFAIPTALLACAGFKRLRRR